MFILSWNKNKREGVKESVGELCHLGKAGELRLLVFSWPALGKSANLLTKKTIMKFERRRAFMESEKGVPSCKFFHCVVS